MTLGHLPEVGGVITLHFPPGHTHQGKWSLCALLLVRYEKWKPPGLRTRGVRSTMRLQDRVRQGAQPRCGGAWAVHERMRGREHSGCRRNI